MPRELDEVVKDKGSADRITKQVLDIAEVAARQDALEDSG